MNIFKFSVLALCIIYTMLKICSHKKHIITCSYDLQVYNKFNYQSKPRVQ
jgi:hypothetical protein